jgi:hypothetical protein
VEVMVASQKASLQFQAMTEVRNKLLSAVPGNHEHAGVKPAAARQG